MRCGLCESSRLTEFSFVHSRRYLRCEDCLLIFVHKDFHLTPEAEYQRYLLHENDSKDPLYRDFFSDFLGEILPRLKPQSRILDFGCGADSALGALLRERGFVVSDYDLYFRHQPELLGKLYDSVLATEVLEHLREPLPALRQMLSCLKAGGLLGIMTRLFEDSISFESWHYPRDPTHLCFWSVRSFEVLADRMGLQPLGVGPKIQIFQKL